MSAADSEYYTQSSRGESAAAYADLWDGAGRVHVWWNLATSDVLQRFGRTYLGVFWLLISFAVLMAVKITFFGGLQSATAIEYAVFLCIGFAVWQFISRAVNDGCTCYISAGPWIKSTRFPHSVYVMQSVAVTTIENAIVIVPVVMVVVALWAPAQSEVSLLVIPALVVLVVNAAAVGLYLGPLNLRYRDVGQFIAAIMRVMMFATPIMWMPQSLRIPQYLIDWNPFARFIGIVRDPLLYGTPGVDHWIFVGVFTLGNVAVALLTYARTRYRQIHWL